MEEGQVMAMVTSKISVDAIWREKREKLVTNLALNLHLSPTADSRHKNSASSGNACSVFQFSSLTPSVNFTRTDNSTSTTRTSRHDVRGFEAQMKLLCVSLGCAGAIINNGWSCATCR